MSYPIILCVVAVEALNLALLWIALRARIRRVARPLVACCGMSGAFGAWVLVIVLHGPVPMMALTVSVFALSSVAMGVAIHLATFEEEDHHDGGAGGAPSLSPEAPGAAATTNRSGGRSLSGRWPPMLRGATASISRSRCAAARRRLLAANRTGAALSLLARSSNEARDVETAPLRAQAVLFAWAWPRLAGPDRGHPPMTSQGFASPIVLEHGLWLHPRSWEGSKQRFERRAATGCLPSSGQAGWDLIRSCTGSLSHPG